MITTESKQSTVLKVIFIIALVVGVVVVVKQSMSKNEGVVCTLEAKLCPDGSYVGRSGPLCEFAKCPVINVPEDWKAVTDTATGITLRYPETIGTTYIHTVDWPPKIQVIDEAFSCTEAGQETERAGETTRAIINGREYCVTRIAEGAAGSIYTQYAYGTELQGEMLFLTFALRASQCGNYDEPQRSACETERTTFDVDALVAKITEGLVFMAQ